MTFQVLKFEIEVKEECMKNIINIKPQLSVFTRSKLSQAHGLEFVADLKSLHFLRKKLEFSDEIAKWLWRTSIQMFKY